MSEGLGEVQEMIDICDFAAGLSRQLYGLTIASERGDHRMMETWHPLGVTGIISAFNFPVAVWAWNAALALVCGNACVWKPSEKTPLTALAAQALFDRALARFKEAGNPRRKGSQPSSSARGTQARRWRITTSYRLSRPPVRPRWAVRSPPGLRSVSRARSWSLAAIMEPSFALRRISTLLCAPSPLRPWGLQGQRCTSLRRLFVHESIYERFLPRLKQAYASVKVGNPLEPETLVGPLIDGNAFSAMRQALEAAAAAGGVVTGGSRVTEGLSAEAFYARPAIVEMPGQAGPVLKETFAPILYVMRYRELPEAIRLHNAVSQGLSSSIFTNDLREAELFLSARGSDCGIANVNIGPSGAEIGGAFGGDHSSSRADGRPRPLT